MRTSRQRLRREFSTDTISRMESAMPVHVCLRAALLSSFLLDTGLAHAQRSTAVRFAVTLPADKAGAPIDGRLLVFISADTSGEPRFQLSDAASTAQVFGIDVDGWKPGESRSVDAPAVGDARRTIADVRRGANRVQALISRYETFRRGDGHVVKLPPDKGEGQQSARKPGNLYSKPLPAPIDPARGD